MFNYSNSKFTAANSAPIFAQKLVDRCHVHLPGESKPTSAICYDGQFYAYVKFFPTLEAARQKADLLIQRGNAALLTRVPTGLVLWVLEPDAQPIKPGSRKVDREF